MIFNEMMKTDTSVSLEAVQESPYELGIGGALMHVYENECNYNSLIKAATLSEMKYYAETGGDLFVQEAGAFKGFLEKVKDFFKKVIEKLKSIAKKFIAKINQYRLSDADFIKKYKKELEDKRISGKLAEMEFNGYRFTGLNADEYTHAPDIVSMGNNVRSESTQEDLDKIIETNRGNILKTDALTSEEFRTKIHEKLYGDKESFKVNISDQIKFIADTKSATEQVNKLLKSDVDKINSYIKALESQKDINEKRKNELLSKDKLNDNDEVNVKKSSGNMERLTKEITVCKAYTNDITEFFGAFSKAIVERNRQAKAICVKALSYKHEAATVAESNTFDIFAGVEIV